ncbi:MAG: DUF5610 domain-containing protein [Gammaproteobacteria bacterium]|nr:DUF5610 domain-containing protein [Gammaproteobacteria bacterium]MBU2056694.1 DUF5610 domain-containing protein [Gammaproteobacteria bacterium]MBU2174031.1 DUF5610 domain-containing protein [Gammaproteobacteria bacterium]MBU2247337.1 DUF5610 domain-containing protein [Gammaproteobacteria bacterium]MBU2345041.1 DUF5610 domain-containing protein [Gammaproteobacteria bacterium]
MSSVNGVGSSNAQAAASKAAESSETTEEKKLSGYESSRMNKQKLNATIMENQLKLSTGDDDNSMKLLYKTALEGINSELEAEFGPNAAEKIKNSGVDTSPQATADRIVGFATAFYQKFSEQNPDMPEEERLDKFLALVGGGVDKGFEDARGILDGLGVLQGKVADDIDSTYSLIQDGFAKFREMILNPDKTTEDQEITESVAANTGSELRFSVKV